MKCPKCNVSMMWDGQARTTYHPMYMYKCPKCGFSDFSSTLVEANDDDDDTITKEVSGGTEQTPLTSNLTSEQMSGFNQSKMQIPDKWHTVRVQAAIVAMQGVMNFFGSIDYNMETIARLAVEQADALIKELKKK